MTDLDLSRELTLVVAGVDGVDDVYPAGTLAQAVTLTVVNVVSDDDVDDAKVAVSRDSSGRLSVIATIGVAGGYAARTVLASVNDALRAHLAAAESVAGTPTIEVKVSRIDTEIAPAGAAS